MAATPGGTTRDAIFNGRATVVQPRRGYRFSLDALLLADFAAAGFESGRFCDAGAGCGVVGTALALLRPATRGVLVERQADLAACARETVAANSLGARLSVLEADLRDLGRALFPSSEFAGIPGEIAGPFDRVVLNPPFQEAGTGRLNPEPGRASARHELHGSLTELVGAAVRLLAPGGRLCVVHRVERERDLRSALSAAGLRVARVRRVRAFPDSPADRLLLEATAEAGAPEVALPDLVVRDAPDRYSPEAERILSGKSG